MKPNPRAMTVVRLRQPPGSDRVDVRFVESARIYTLRVDAPGFGQLLSRLQTALDSRRAVWVTLATPGSDTIVDVADVDD